MDPKKKADMDAAQKDSKRRQARWKDAIAAGQQKLKGMKAPERHGHQPTARPHHHQAAAVAEHAAAPSQEEAPQAPQG